MKNKFGGHWTEEKIQILETYAKQFLQVFKNKPQQKLLYFDGFAGSGEIELIGDDSEIIEGAAVRVLKLDTSRSFDMYYFVEKKETLAESLELRIKNEFPNKTIHVVSGDCNKKLLDLSNFLKSSRGKDYKVLGFIDPKGMQLEWAALESLRNLHIDLWILNPTSGTNRLLTKSGLIDETWINRLQLFLGMQKEQIQHHFYKSTKDLFGDITLIKEEDCINKLHELYSMRIKGSIFKYVSKAKVLRNNSGAPLFHFFMATNNPIALRIAESVVNPKKI